MAQKRSAGPYKYDDDDDYVPSGVVEYSDKETSHKKVKKHTLDSDEEDENYEPKDVLNDDDIDGQEEVTEEFDGETKITPFNMKEEMEEGYFNREGFYQFKKDTASIKDAWLDDIDWVKVKHTEKFKNKYGSDEDSDEAPEVSEKQLEQDRVPIYTEMLTYMKPLENVAKTLKRLSGNKKVSSAERWKLKKSGALGKAGDSMKDFLKLTELANKIVETGNMNVYQETYEMITLKVKQTSVPPPEPVDMFSSDMPAAEKRKIEEQSSEPDNVTWQFKWENTDTAEVHGPFPTEKMLKWQTSGFFDKGVYVQQVKDQGGPWYTSKRIDFDLYL